LAGQICPTDDPVLEGVEDVEAEVRFFHS
jgi:hypothetical protein